MISVDAGEFRRLVLDVEMMKKAFLAGRVCVDFEGEPNEKFLEELEEARNIPDSENISLDELERRISLI